jgi:DNA-binding transcriptional regulator YdaS (Cro superfamily)
VTPAEEFVADLARICLPASLAGRLFGVSRATVYRWAQGRTRIPEAARRILKSEVESCSVRRYQLTDGRVIWQGLRDGRPMGPVAGSREQAFRFALDLPR